MLRTILILAMVVAGCGTPEPDSQSRVAANPSLSEQTSSAALPTRPAQSGDHKPEALSATGWGPLRIGMTVRDITASVGADSDPKAVGGPDPEQCDQFHPVRTPSGLLVMVENGRLTRISLTGSAAVKTDRGIGIGEAKARIVDAYGEAARETPHKYEPAPAAYLTVWQSGGAGENYVDDPKARGIVYELGGDNRVEAIHAGGPSIQYVEGCA
ncbi:hypothetical protein [Sphingosinicella sp. BN140058]|uniref:hypothetical protein n=1 Tax=Sphingosinicella sp. BN140058 TaxID=1892855 RepID=UPI0010115C4C|nr:hypothetical protein [Sphingosinicella sp. BN140058]QAY75701.1 hypothetical protein ETR14_03525 [Sphingosinicella sp. BN140058]